MGIGHYRHPDAETVHLDLMEGIPSEEWDDAELHKALYDRAIETIHDALAGTAFEVARKQRWRRSRSFGNDALVVASNDLYDVFVHEGQDGSLYVNYGLGEGIDERLDGLARAHLKARAERFFDRLAETQRLYVATSAWTSAPRRDPHAPAALPIAA